MKVIEDIAVHCGANLGFGVNKLGMALRNRFGMLAKEFKKDQCRSMRKSERERILLDVIALTNGWDENIESDNNIKQAKQRKATKSSEELMRRLAMKEASDDDSQEDVSDLPAAKSSRKRSAEPGRAKKKRTEEKRRYDADEAEKRRQYELKLEGRRKKANEEREKRMFEFIRTTLIQKNSKE
ncbi:hypothetical protein JG687_00019287 [Phytophthora cactorum]|uniref:Uncharacterized protein n=1 Tax=Phytophthora cactorum TaxID=29920 RepID=A0A8T1TM80_9STRA|nr:hypothetical protein JG687_00019287 [Phytophthora cactorum]